LAATVEQPLPKWDDPVPEWADPVPAWGEPAPMWGELEPIWAQSAPPGEGGAPAAPPSGSNSARVRGVAVISVLAVVVLGVVGVSSAEIISKLNSASGVGPAASDVATPTAGPTPTGPGTTAGQGAAGSATPATPTPQPPPPVARLAIRGVRAFGPDGLADGDNPSHAADAIAPHAPRPWRTQWYATADFGHLKHGTGLLLDMGRRVTVASVQIQLGGGRGADLQIRAGDAPVPGQLPVVAAQADVGGLLTVWLREPVRSRYVLLWWVKLPPAGSGKYQASVYGVIVNGRP
jgi:hypothetical protein